ncbi:MFS transporter [Novosphingobium terrae]|uniref:MFS transporter n=1 Tax=Novosphingobium terrae TaxID=2726189 RepID=UPI00197CFEB6|nr:MFS transporter [Novosphingobium terrae]
MEAREGVDSKRRRSTLAACAVGAALGYGTLGIAVFGQFVVPLSVKLKCNPEDLELAFSIMAVGSVLGPPVAGACIDRYGTRLVAAISAALMGVMLFALGSAASLMQVYVLYGLVSLLGTGTLVVGYSRPIVAAFDRDRGMALGLMLASVGAASAILPPVIANLNERYGVGGGFTLLGGISCGVALIVVAFIPTRGGGGRVVLAAARSRGVTASIFSRTGMTLLAISFLLGVFTSGVWSQAMPLMLAKGIDSHSAATVMSYLAVVMTLTRIGAGWAMDRIFAPRLGALLILPVLLAWLIFAGASDLRTAMFAVAVLGVGVGVEFDLLSFLVSRYMVRDVYAGVYGILYSAISLGLAASRPLVMFVEHMAGSMAVAPIVLAAATGAATLLLLTLPSYSLGFAAERGSRDPGSGTMLANGNLVVIDGQ